MVPIEINVYTVCAQERESAGSHSGTVLLCTHWQPSNCRAIVHACYIAEHHILLIFEAKNQSFKSPLHVYELILPLEGL